MRLPGGILRLLIFSIWVMWWSLDLYMELLSPSISQMIILYRTVHRSYIGVGLDSLFKRNMLGLQWAENYAFHQEYLCFRPCSYDWICVFWQPHLQGNLLERGIFYFYLDVIFTQDSLFSSNELILTSVLIRGSRSKAHMPLWRRVNFT